MRNGFILLFTSLCIASCQKELTNNPAAALAAQTQPNISYGTDALQKLDIYLPAGRTATTTKVIILIHGGAWSGGDKTELNSSIDTLKRRLPQYAIFNINYRLASGASNLFPSQEDDVKSAIDFIFNKSI